MKSSRPCLCVMAAMALLFSTAAQAQGIWRCGPQGNSFSDRPCADGQVLTAPPAPSATAVQQATEVARREAALAMRLRTERLAQEQQLQRAQAALHRAEHQARKKDPTPKTNAAKGQGRQRAQPLEAAVPLRVAAGPRALSPKAERAPSAAAGARTSAAAAHGFPARRD